MNRSALAVSLAAFSLAPLLAHAQDATTPGTPEVYPTFECLGVRVPYSGDANGNARAHLEWRRVGALAWTTGMDMTRISNSRWAGSVMWLAPNRNYQVRAVISDPDGSATTSSVQVQTRALPSAVATGTTWWVDLDGSDSNAGTEDHPFATWQAAANRAHAGDEIRIRPGVYYQQVNIGGSGTSTALIHLVADAPGVVLDGSDPSYLHRTDWQSEGSGIYSVGYARGGNRLVVADSTQRLYKQGSLADLQANANGMSQGFAIENGRLYVKLEDGSDPAGHTMHVARYNYGIYDPHSYWHFSGITVRYFGTDPHSIASGLDIENGEGNWISHCRVELIGGRAIFLRTNTANNLIEQNLVVDRVGYWPWTATKGHDEEITGISNRAGRGNVIRFNTVRGSFDGLDANDGSQDENVASDADYYRNVVVDNGDDAIETDTVSGINLRLWNNTFDHTFNGVSMAPIYQGPEYVLYNTITNFKRSAFKFSLFGTGTGWLCHNTTWTNDVLSSTVGAAADHPSGPYSNMHFRNNILTGNRISPVDDDADESQSGCDFDGDVLNPIGTSNVFHWKGAYYTSLAALKSGTGFEGKGRAGDPMFVSALTGDFRILSASPAVDGAVRLPGINDRFVGVGPDIGAIEFSSSGDVIPPAAIDDLR